MKQNQNNKMMVSIYKDFTQKLGVTNLLEIFKDIKSDKYKNDIESIRYALHKNADATASHIKNKLTSFTTSGTFGKSRTKNNIISYSQILCLDFDNIPVTEINNLSSVVNQCRYTFASFISPSGMGLKVFIKINSNAEQHTTVYNQVTNLYNHLSGYKIDEKCKDITRLCFVSYDTELFLNENADVFEIKQEPIISKKLEKFFQENTTDELLDKCLKFTEKKEQYYSGNRNNFIFLFSSNANKFGINEEDTLDFCLANFDLEEKEIKATVKSTYRNQSVDFAKFAKFANVQTSSESDEINNENCIDNYEDCLKNTPLIPQSVYDNLPSILFESCQNFSQKRERDVFLTGALAILSGCLPNVTGIYSGNLVYTNLFSFILAPAASGKGALKFSKILADKYHDKVLANSIELKKKYDDDIADYKTLKTKGKLKPRKETPKPPKFKVVFIPANTSNAKIIQHLDNNEGRGIICETEADTLGQTFKNEWGAYSDMLRKSFHHEKISVSRKTDGEFIEVNSPQLAVALSGTPKQVFNIITSAEDGLFSRFIFYVFKTEAIWLDPSPKKNPVNLTNFFSSKSKEVLQLVEFYENNEINFNLTDEQWEKFNPFFRTFLDQINTFVSEDAVSIVKRLGLILYRFCMIFTAIRKFEEKNHVKDTYCQNIDFETALALTETYIQHSLIMFTNLPKQGEQVPFKSAINKKKFLEALPSNFQRKEAIKIGEMFSLKDRSVDSFLKTCLGKYLEQPEYGFYRKL